MVKQVSPDRHDYLCAYFGCIKLLYALYKRPDEMVAYGVRHPVFVQLVDNDVEALDLVYEDVVFKDARKNNLSKFF